METRTIHIKPLKHLRVSFANNRLRAFDGHHRRCPAFDLTAIEFSLFDTDAAFGSLHRQAAFAGRTFIA